MDLNYLLRRYKTTLFNSRRAVSSEARFSHARLALLYSRQIERLRANMFPDGISPKEGALPSNHHPGHS